MQRTRTRPFDPTSQYNETYCHQTTAPGAERDLWRQSGFTEFPNRITMKDQVNPGYYKAKREGKLLPVGPMWSEKIMWDVIPAACSGRMTYKGLGWTQDYNFVGLARGWDTQWDAILRPTVVYPDPNIYLQEALASAQTNAWDTATFLAELGKTTEMLVGLRGRIQQHYNKVIELGDRIHSSRNTGKLLFAYADAFSEAWLTLRYGLRPLYYDALAIKRAVDQLTSGIDNPLSRGWSTGNEAVFRSAVRAGVSNAWNIPTGGGSSSSTRMEWSAYKEVTLVPRATVGVRVTTRAATMFDMAVTSWELMPWSFILDWFISVGDMIAAFSPFATGTREYSTYALQEVETHVYTFRPILIPSGSWEGGASGSAGTVSRSFSIYDRSVDRVPQPVVGFNLNIDGFKILDLVTIIYSLKSGILKRLAFRR